MRRPYGPGMMGEFVLYYNGKVVGGVYDSRLLAKPTPSAKRLMPNAPMELPYEGAKEMLLVEKMDDRVFCKVYLRSLRKNCPHRKGEENEMAAPQKVAAEESKFLSGIFEQCTYAGINFLSKKETKMQVVLF